jgi:hypothetical protein
VSVAPEGRVSFTCDRYREADGMKYHTYPSLKYPEDQRFLWDGLLDDVLGLEILQVARGQAQPLGIDVGIVLAEQR